MTTVINIHEDSFMFMTGVMSCLWQCRVSLMHTPSNKVLPRFESLNILLLSLSRGGNMPVYGFYVSLMSYFYQWVTIGRDPYL